MALHRSEHSPAAPFAAVEVEVGDVAGSVVLAGLATTDGDHVLATYDPDRGRVGIEVRRAGSTRVARRKRAAKLTPGDRFAFALCENQVTVLADRGDGWRPLVTERRRVAGMVDLRDTATLARHSYAWGTRGASSPAELSVVRAGLFGMAGVRDPHLVQHADGTPYVRDGKAYLTATCAGLGFFQQAHWGVFTLDLTDPTRLEQTAQLYSHRDGLLLGDHAGQLVRDDDNDRWIVAVSSWGDFSRRRGVHVRHTTTTADLLHGVHVLETERVPLPTAVSAWDPAVTRIDGTWHVGFVESPSQNPFDFHPALAVTDRPEWTQGLRLVDAATNLHQCEGPILARLQEQWWLLASDGRRKEFPVFDLEMRRVGSLDAPYLTNIPHPQVVRLPDGGWLMISFDGAQYAEKVLGYGGHGDVVVLRADTAGTRVSSGPAVH